ncbi:MAG TPA: hypothetical protein DCZ75_06450 [Geobacter sp.]|nr:hypothetical protein [Geobacter sp.]
MLNRLIEWWRDGFEVVQIKSQFLLLSPALTLLVIDFYKCILEGEALGKRPRIVTIGLTAIVVSSALIQFDKTGSRKLVGDNPICGTEFLSLSLISLELNGVLYCLLFLPNFLIALAVRAVWDYLT